MKNILIREIKVLDAKYIKDISKNDLGYEADLYLVKHRIETLDKSREIVFIAEMEQEVIGYVHAELYKTLYCDTMVNILGMVIKSEYQRKGIGKLLMEQAENWGRKIGARKIRLNSAMTRKGAHEFYRKLGYLDEKNQIRFLKEL